LRPAKAVYDKHDWWSRPGNNWSQVCGSGIALAAAAIEEREPALGRDLWDRGVKLVAGCHKFYEPDGCYPEGPGYWHYGTNYHVLLLAAAASLDKEAPVPDVLQRSGDFIIQLTGSSGLPFNFADAHAGRSEFTAAQAWIAGHFHDAGQAARLRARLAAGPGGGKPFSEDRFAPLELLWLPPEPRQGAPQLPVAALFGGEQAVAALRTAWSDDAVSLAVKGGTPAVNHGHMDVGSFVYDAHRTRWIHDLGSDDYNLPGYFGGQRWNYFRLNSLSHNTLVIGGKLQDRKAAPCPVTSHRRDGSWSTVVFDLGPAYRGQADEVTRTVKFDHASGVAVVSDGITKPTGEVRWAVVTDAETAVAGRDVVLRKKGETVTLRRMDQGGGGWEVTDAKPPTAREKPNPGFRMVWFTVPAAAKIAIEVALRPG